MVPLVEGQSLGWPAWLWIPVAVGALLLVVFVAYSRRRMRRDGSALLPMPLFADRGFSAGIVTQATFQGALNAFTLPFIIYLQIGLGFDALTAGLNLLAFSLGALVGTAAVIPLVARLGKVLVTAGSLILAGGVLWVFAVVAETGAAFTGWAAVWPMLVSGLGLALLIIPLVDVALATVPVADAGAASGAYSTFQQLGAAAGVAISTTVFFSVIGDDWSREHVLTALQASVWVAVGRLRHRRAREPVPARSGGGAGAPRARRAGWPRPTPSRRRPRRRPWTRRSLAPTPARAACCRYGAPPPPRPGPRGRAGRACPTPAAAAAPRLRAARAGRRARAPRHPSPSASVAGRRMPRAGIRAHRDRRALAPLGVGHARRRPRRRSPATARTARSTSPSDDLHAARDDHVVGPAGDAQRAVVRERAEVARAIPARAVGVGRNAAAVRSGSPR